MPVTRVYLGESLSLASLAPVIEHLRSAFHASGDLVEIDSRDVVSITDAASILLNHEMEQAQRRGVRFQMAA
ncbi:MAG: hypothetical protein AAF721_19115 [Myxococcota bacterium]